MDEAESGPASVTAAELVATISETEDIQFFYLIGPLTVLLL